jgi:hypothetical protein
MFTLVGFLSDLIINKSTMVCWSSSKHALLHYPQTRHADLVKCLRFYCNHEIFTCPGWQLFSGVSYAQWSVFWRRHFFRYAIFYKYTRVIRSHKLKDRQYSGQKKMTKGQTMIYKMMNRKLSIKQHEFHK